MPVDGSASAVVGDDGMFAEDGGLLDGGLVEGLIGEEDLMATAEKKPKDFFLPSQEWPISAQEAADTLLKAQEIKRNKELLKAAVIILILKKRAIEAIT